MEKHRARGHPRITEYLPLSTQKIIAAYRLTGSPYKTATMLHISYWTVRNYLRAAGIGPKPPEGGKPQARSISTWYKRHPDAATLRSPSKIAFIAGFPRETVKTYLRKRRARERTRVEAIMMRVSRATMSLVDPSGWSIDPYTFRVSLVGSPWHVTIEELERACKDLESEAGQTQSGAARKE